MKRFSTGSIILYAILAYQNMLPQKSYNTVLKH